jgi:ATPase subunit of ABC transporter with duplicated ATPase domains
LLERWIGEAARHATMVIASHDRQFLDACTTHTLFLRDGISRGFAHPYTRARRLLAEEDAAHEAVVERDAREVERLRQSASALRNIGINSRSDAAQKKSLLMSRRADRLEQSLRPIHTERSGDIRLANRGTHARTLLRLDDIVVPAPDGRALFRTGRLHVLQQDRIVVLGRNGVGKSQFVGLLRRVMIGAGTVPDIAVSPSVVPAWIDQDMSQLPATSSPLAFIGDTFRLGDQRSTSLLAGAGFAVEKQRQPIGRLSPGQKARLALLALRLAEPNFYLMDEPTSHVDIHGQERLEAEILEHGATCILVSHDRRFMQSIGTRFLLIDNGRMAEIDGPEEFWRTLAAG